MFLDKLIEIAGGSSSERSIFDRVFGHFGWFAQRTKAGEVVSPDTMISIPAVFRALDNISSHIAMLPLPVVEETADADGVRSKRRLRDHPVHAILNLQANRFVTAFQFRKTRIAHKLLFGNSYAEIVRFGDGRVGECHNLSPRNVRPRWAEDGRTLYYEVYNEETRKWEQFEARDILHDAGLTNDGILGAMIAEIGRENFGLIQALDSYAQTYFGNGGMPRIVFEQEIPLGETNQGAAKFAQSFDESNSGDNRNKSAVLPPGVKAKTVGEANDANQLLESRTFSIRDCCRWFNIPPTMLFEASDIKFSNAGEMASAYVKLSLVPLMVSEEQEMNRKLFTDAEKRTLYVEHSAEGLLRGDFKSRMEGY